MTEYGHRFIPEEQKKDLIQLQPDTGWDTFRGIISKKLPKEFRTVVVDTVGPLYNLCMEWTCAKNNMSHPSDGAHGKGWNIVRLEFQNQIARLANMCQSVNATLLMIDHSKEEEIVTTTERTIKINCAMPGQARSVLLPVPDHIWYLGYAEPEDNEKVDPQDAFKSKGSKRALFVGGSIRIEAGCRDPKVKKAVIVPLSRLKPFEQLEKELYT